MTNASRLRSIRFKTFEKLACVATGEEGGSAQVWASLAPSQQPLHRLISVVGTSHSEKQFLLEHRRYLVKRHIHTTHFPNSSTVHRVASAVL